MKKVLMSLFVVTLIFGMSQAQEEARLEQAQQYVNWFYEGKTDQLWDIFSEDLKANFGTPQDLAAFQEGMTETEVLSERVIPMSKESYEYLRIVRLEGIDEDSALQWIIDGETVNSLLVSPLITGEEAPSDYLDYETQAPLRVPFDREVFVFWGGRSVLQNYHAAAPDQRFSYDFLIVEEGSSYQNDGATNEDYYCFGVPVLAPGDGTITASVDGIPDQTPGEMNPDQPMGNHIIIDHGNGEFSFLAHLQEGSVKVAVGDAVTAGDELGACGNSGNSSEAHLHYHLQTTGVPFEGEGLPAQFETYLADGEEVARGEPVRGQFVKYE